MKEDDEKTAKTGDVKEPTEEAEAGEEIDEETEEVIKEPSEAPEAEEPLEGELEEVVEAEGAASVEEIGLEEAPLEEEKRPPRREVEEEEFVEERTYTIPLRKAWIAPPRKRAPRAVRIIKDFVNRHMKLESRVKLEEEEEPKKLILSNELNEKIWRRGIEKPPRRVRVRAAKDKDGNVTLFLAEGD